MLILGFDPGRDKCGLALVNETGTVIRQEVVSSDQVLLTIEQWYAHDPMQKIVMGNQTTSKQWQETLQAKFPLLPILRVDERNTTLEARDRYWELYPPKGLMRLIPKGMRVPPGPIDDIVAIILVERSTLSEE
jgi:RNase H-fold protein (predicted Holliday junction resolvase)